MFTVALVVMTTWVLVALIISHREKTHILWGRATLIMVAVYSLGAFLGFWRWNEALPFLKFIIHELGG